MSMEGVRVSMEASADTRLGRIPRTSQEACGPAAASCSLQPGIPVTNCAMGDGLRPVRPIPAALRAAPTRAQRLMLLPGSSPCTTGTASCTVGITTRNQLVSSRPREPIEKPWMSMP
jgi:hypothetical protein